MFFIAKRYLLSEKSHSVVNIISVVSLVSLLIPVAAVIVLLSVFNGFGSLVGELSRAVDSDLTIMLREGRMFGEGDVDCEELRAIDGVEAVSLVTEQMMLVEYRDQSRLLTFRGVDEDYLDVVPIETMVSVGRFEVELGDLERVVLGSSVASGLGIRSLYDTDLRLYALRSGALQSLLPMAGRVEQSVAQLAGVVLMDQEAEERYGYASRRLINRLSGSEGRASRVVIKLAKGADKERVRGVVERGVGAQFKVVSREELNPALYDIIKYEKLGVLLICSLVMLLASFSLVGALAMLIIEKRGDMSRLRAMGATRGELRQIFIIEGGLISGVAIVGGVVLGSIVSLAQQWFGFVKMPQGSMLGANYPVDLQVVDVLTVVVIASVIAMVLTQMVVRKMFGNYR
ncbi:MAG: FtsX-like permease family protein [Rikenellaceae bacterium]